MRARLGRGGEKLRGRGESERRESLYFERMLHACIEFGEGYTGVWDLNGE